VRRTVEEYLRLPWTIVVRYHDEQGGYWSARVAEIPSLMYATDKRDDLLSELEQVMIMCFEDSLARGEPIPEPAAAGV
jgi:predicted RNase H-like HicB family nuclease